nr:hypothetical protein [Fodinibius sp.]NIY30547.1 hypothetical protein [Fodinibius sp.]
MALRIVSIGSGQEVHQFDDLDFDEGIYTDAPIWSATPWKDDHVLRYIDVPNGLPFPVTAITVLDTPYTATIDEYFINCDCSGGNIVINLPTAIGQRGKTFVITKIDASANTVTVDAFGAETINGALTAALSSRYESLNIYSDGANWLLSAASPVHTHDHGALTGLGDDDHTQYLLLAGRGGQTIEDNIIINQQADDSAIQINAYDDQSSEWAKIYLDSFGATSIDVYTSLWQKWRGTNIANMNSTGWRMEDDKLFAFGASSDYSFEYDSTGTQFVFASTDIDGGGTDGNIFTVQDGTDDVTFEGTVTILGNLGVNVTPSYNLHVESNTPNIVLKETLRNTFGTLRLQSLAAANPRFGFDVGTDSTLTNAGLWLRADSATLKPMLMEIITDTSINASTKRFGMYVTSTQSVLGSSSYRGNNVGNAITISTQALGAAAADAAIFIDNASDQKVKIGSNSPDAQLHVESQAITNIGMIVQGDASQTADLVQFIDSGDNVIHSFALATTTDPTTYINKQQEDIDTVIKSDNVSDAFKIDAGTDT